MEIEEISQVYWGQVGWEQDRLRKEWRERVLAEVTEIWGYLWGNVEMYCHGNSQESMRVTTGKSPSSGASGI